MSLGWLGLGYVMYLAGAGVLIRERVWDADGFEWSPRLGFTVPCCVFPCCDFISYLNFVLFVSLYN